MIGDDAPPMYEAGMIAAFLDPEKNVGAPAYTESATGAGTSSEPARTSSSSDRVMYG